MDQRFVTVAVFFDFSKAFPSVNHDLLVHKLRSFNISMSLRNWFGSYMNSHFHSISDANGSFSDWDRLECGVSQGAALSSLLFNLFVSDLGNDMKYCKFHEYADDFKIYLSVPLSTLSELLQKVQCDIDYVVEWAKNNALTLNSSKTHTMVLQHRLLLFHNP